MTPRPLLAVSRDQASTAAGRRCRASFAQRRLWFFEQMDSGTSVMHMTTVVNATGTLHAAALARALDTIESRHESLRTRFADEGGDVVQVIDPPRGAPLSQIDLRTIPSAQREDEARRLMSESATRPFDLRGGPLWRAVLLRTAEDGHCLVLCVHHLITDGTSFNVLLRELSALYRAYHEGVPFSLPPLAVQYADFAEWQRDDERDAGHARHLAYWVDRLHSAPAALDLPTDRPRPAAQTFRGATVKMRVDPALASRLERIARERGASLFMVLLSAYAALMSRLSGQDDIVVGVPVAGRVRQELEPLIGLFVNMVPLRIDVSGDLTFLELLARARTTSVDGFEHQSTPVEQIVAAVHPDRARTTTPLFQTLFNMEVADGDGPARIGDLVAQIDKPFELASKFDLTLYVTRGPQRLDLALVYNADLFDGARMDGMLEQYRQILAQIAARPGMSVAALDLRTDAARRVLPDPAAPIRREPTPTVLSRFREHAARAPESVAVAWPEGHWSYAELDARSSAIARRLLEGGVRPGEVVAVYAHRSAPLAAAVLGVMRAGAAFSMLDPQWPGARLAACVRAAAPVACIQIRAAGEPPSELEAEFAACRTRVTVDLDEDLESPTPSADVPPDPERLAYVAFTSGSTGGVKAIAGAEPPLAHFLAWQAATFSLSSDDRCGLLSGLGHDPLLRDLFAPLWSGGRLEIPPDGDVHDGHALARWFGERRITVAHLTPALGRLLVDSARHHGGLPSLRHVFFAGDVLTASLVDEFREAAPGAECVNFYGATETPQAMGFWRVPTAQALVSLGRGIDGVQLLIAGPGGQPAGIGEPGEILVRTPYLSRGYHNDPSLTAERFVVNSCTADPADIVYRTGDRGRYRPDGAVDFAGRRDAQLKIRGFRVEPGEIEQALRSHASVEDAVVVVRAVDGDPNQREIVGHWVNRAQQPVTTGAALRGFLKTLLPGHSVPARLHKVARLPLTANGKVDRAALEALQHDEVSTTPFVEPGTPTERTLAEMWAGLMRAGRIGIDDSFFDRGGHSLMAMQVMTRIRERFGVEVPLRVMFDAPTIRALASAVDRVTGRTDAPNCDDARVEIEL